MNTKYVFCEKDDFNASVVKCIRQVKRERRIKSHVEECDAALRDLLSFMANAEDESEVEVEGQNSDEEDLGSMLD